MTIAILPARLANQIAAGEVVERPASVIKELIENSLDAGATSIHIDVDKGGIKKIKITDNGHGIVKDELTLALSRHATSKIKDLNDLEAIDSLGFRGEALASISSVSRLTLTSKPNTQATAWQAIAEGRDMLVQIKPAAHPDGTSIEVLDLFFNTPARRKFLRTEKTEFNHIDEVVRRIALAHFHVSFMLTHNGKTVRQYRIASTHAQQTKRVASVCGPKFIEHAVEVDCPHDNMTLSGWLAKPSFSRSQNDLCYSYVNGRMMRDKLINHAIRQAYADLLPPDTYPAFVLFLECDYREVDVNVHPAKHEVRFHQGRYIHDFIVSVCQQTLAEQRVLAQDNVVENNEFKSTSESQHSYQPIHSGLVNQEYSQQQHSQQEQEQVNQSYIKPLTPVSSNDSKYYSSGSVQYQSPQVSERAAQSYQRLMTPLVQETEQTESVSNNDISVVQSSEQQCLVKLINIVESKYATILIKNKLRLLSLSALEQYLHLQNLRDKWQNGLISQPLLLPIKLSLDSLQMVFIKEYQTPLEKCGVVIKVLNNTSLQIRAFPSLLRDKDVSYSFTALIEPLMGIIDRELTDEDWLSTFSFLMTTERYDDQQALSLLNRVQNKLTTHFEQQLLLNSITIDLTSAISQFK